MHSPEEYIVKNELLRQKAQGQFKTFTADCKIESLQKKKVLEIGFKNGLFLDECHKAGLAATGLEINRQYFEAVRKEFPYLELLHYDGGDFPLPGNSFDFVVSFQVLEHVSSTEDIIRECLRVLKPGGIMYHICPNYHSFYEGHYNILWLPFLTKKTARLYLRFLKRCVPGFKDLDLYKVRAKDVWHGHGSEASESKTDEVRYVPGSESFNLIKPNHVMKIIKKYQGELELVSLGEKEFIAGFNKERIGKVKQKFLRKILELVIVLPGVRPFFLWIICRAGLYYPMTIILKKKT